MNALENGIAQQLEGRLKRDFLVKIVRRLDRELRGNHYPGFLFPEKIREDTVHYLLLEKTLDNRLKRVYTSPENQPPISGTPGIISLNDLFVKYMIPHTGISGREQLLQKVSRSWVPLFYTSFHPPVPTPPPRALA